MEGLNNQTKLYIVDNFGYTRSDEITSTVWYHCFINECEFETTNLGELLDHSDGYREKWVGFCYKCNAQIYDKPVQLTLELKHMTLCHKLHNNGIGITVRLSEDKRTELRDALNFVRAERPSCKISLKPWIKSSLKTTQNDYRRMLEKRCLYALFKCMDINCTFYTTRAECMLSHLQHHEHLAPSKANNPSEVSRWLECAYCDRTSDSCSSLVQHIEIEHSSSLYQCPYCFYRSCAAYNVVFHLQQCHQSLQQSVLVCNGNETDFAAEKEAIERYRSQNIRPLRCSEGGSYKPLSFSGQVMLLVVNDYCHPSTIIVCSLREDYLRHGLFRQSFAELNRTRRRSLQVPILWIEHFDIGSG